MNIAQYNKLIVALVTIAIFLVQKRYGVSLGPISPEIVEVVLLVANPFLVYLVPNRAKAGL